MWFICGGGSKRVSPMPKCRVLCMTDKLLDNKPMNSEASVSVIRCELQLQFFNTCRQQNLYAKRFLVNTEYVVTNANDFYY